MHFCGSSSFNTCQATFVWCWSPLLDTTNLDSLAELCLQGMEVAEPTVSTVQYDPSPQLSSEVDQLRAEVTRLQGLVKSLSLSKRSRTPTRRPPTPHSVYPNAGTLCWCHAKYGEATRKFKVPCDTISSITVAMATTGIPSPC